MIWVIKRLVFLLLRIRLIGSLVPFNLRRLFNIMILATSFLGETE